MMTEAARGPQGRVDDSNREHGGRNGGECENHRRAGTAEAAMSAPENKEWLASRKEIGRQINPETADVTWQARPVLEPYELCEHLPDQIWVRGREYFARSVETEDWVGFDDLPKRARIDYGGGSGPVNLTQTTSDRPKRQFARCKL